ncbi:MAG: PAS domain-containing protein [Vicinamibacterales bacterium]
MHTLLRRQIKRAFGAAGAPDALKPLIGAVNEAYRAFDDDRLTLERSLELSSSELLKANTSMRAIFQALPDRFLRIDATGLVLEEQGGEADKTFPVPSAVGLKLQDIFPFSSSRIDEAMARAAQTASVVRLDSASSTNSLEHVFEIRFMPLPDRHLMAVIRNVTQQAAIECERERGLSLLRATLESTADGILVADNEGRILDFNKRFLEMWRIPPDVVSTRREDLALQLALGQLKDPDAFLRKVQELYHEPSAVSWDVLELTDGRVFERYSQPQTINGQNVGRVWSFHDVTEVRRSQERLNVQRTYFRQVLDLLPMMVFARDTAGRFVLVNKTMADLHGTSPDALLGRTNADLHEGAPPIDAADLDVLNGTQAQLTSEEAVADARGQVRWFQTVKRAIPSPDGAAQQVLAVATDITDRKRGEEDLRRRTEHLLQKQVTWHELALRDAGSLEDALSQITTAAARILSASRISVWLYEAGDTALVCKYVHSQDHETSQLGTRLEAAEYSSYFDALHEGRLIASGDALDDPRTRQFREQYLAPLGVTAMMDVPVRREGHVIGIVFFEHVGPPRTWTLEEKDTATSIVDFVSLALESDSRRQLEGQLRQSQKMEAIGLLAGGVAHDFNNLLGVITGYAELVTEELPEDHASRTDLQKIITAANCAADLTRKLLAFSKRQVLQVKLFDLNNIVSDFARMLGRIVGEDLEVVVQKSSTPLTVKADSGQMEQVLLNLCSNSRQAMPDGGRVTLESGWIELSPDEAAKRQGARPGAYATLRVSDTGIGMDERTLAHIFEPFFTTKPTGTGLGLATVYGIVQQHNGFIEVESELGLGTSITVYLPLQAAQAKAKEPDAVGRTRGGNETILIAEDETMLRDLMSESLGQLGYTIRSVPDGEEAVRAFSAAPDDIALAILDTVMPKLNGPDAYVRMRALKPHLKAIFISGYAADPAKLAEVLETESLTFIQKPFSPRVVAQKVREVLDQRSEAA